MFRNVAHTQFKQLQISDHRVVLIEKTRLFSHFNLCELAPAIHIS